MHQLIVEIYQLQATEDIRTTPLYALRRKKALQDSHEIASKLYPSALSPHTPQILSSLVFLPDLLPLPMAAPSTLSGIQ